MTPPERVFALRRAVEYVVARRIPGAFVECGVWRGGSMMVVALTLLEHDIDDRDLWLYDTYEGMTAPTSHDRRWSGEAAAELFDEAQREGRRWADSPLADVRRNLASTGYPGKRSHFVVGAVEATIPSEAPETIALLRLDTDWYESTKHELEHLFPRLASKGPLLIDDYGHWEGARRAVDEYFATSSILLTRVDASARLAVKD